MLIHFAKLSIEKMEDVKAVMLDMNSRKTLALLTQTGKNGIQTHMSKPERNKPGRNNLERNNPRENNPKRNNSRKKIMMIPTGEEVMTGEEVIPEKEEEIQVKETEDLTDIIDSFKIHIIMLIFLDLKTVKSFYRHQILHLF